MLSFWRNFYRPVLVTLIFSLAVFSMKGPPWIFLVLCSSSGKKTFHQAVRKSNSGVGESFTSDWKLNRQKGCFSELASSLEVTVYFSLHICSIGSRLPKTSSNGIIQLLLYSKNNTG